MRERYPNLGVGFCHKARRSPREIDGIRSRGKLYQMKNDCYQTPLKMWNRILSNFYSNCNKMDTSRTCNIYITKIAVKCTFCMNFCSFLEFKMVISYVKFETTYDSTSWHKKLLEWTFQFKILGTNQMSTKWNQVWQVVPLSISSL